MEKARANHRDKVKAYEGVKGDNRKTAKANELSRDIAEAVVEENEAKAQYELLKTAMSNELGRFQNERVQNFKDMLMGYARCNADYHAEIARRWGELLKDLDAEFASM